MPVAGSERSSRDSTLSRRCGPNGFAIVRLLAGADPAVLAGDPPAPSMVFVTSLRVSASHCPAAAGPQFWESPLSRGEDGQRHCQPAPRRELRQINELVRRVDGV